MGCVHQITVYRSEGDKLFVEAGETMSCDRDCSSEWSGANEVMTVCYVGFDGTRKVNYRLTYRDGTWHSTRSDITP